MRKLYFAVPSIIAALSISPAFASGGAQCENTSGEWLSHEAISTMATEMGYDVRRVETDDSCYEVYAFDQSGRRVEIYMHPVTGVVVKVEHDS